MMPRQQFLLKHDEYGRLFNIRGIIDFFVCGDFFVEQDLQKNQAENRWQNFERHFVRQV